MDSVFRLIEHYGVNLKGGERVIVIRQCPHSAMLVVGYFSAYKEDRSSELDLPTLWFQHLDTDGEISRWLIERNPSLQRVRDLLAAFDHPLAQRLAMQDDNKDASA